MIGFKRIVPPGEVVYRGLQFSGDKFVKAQIIARFLAHDTDSRRQSADVDVTPANYVFAYDGGSSYNGHAAYVFLLKPRRKGPGLFRGELWLDADTGAPLRLWGDLVKSPSFFVRSFRFVKDYRSIDGCAEPLRLLVTARARIVGTVEITMWSRPASAEAESDDGRSAVLDFKRGGQSAQ
jgi:hypothetical protein